MEVFSSAPWSADALQERAARHPTGGLQALQD
jgi:hypothetical protein